jgi:hypothetical protein
VTLKLNKDVNLSAIEKLINENGGNIQDKKNPEFYYVQLVSTQKSIGSVRDFIQLKYDFIKEVLDYPNKK